MARKSNLPLLQSRQNPRIQQKNTSILMPMPEDDTFLDEIIAWADINNVDDDQISRKKETLFRTQFLFLHSNKLTEIPDAICKLINISKLYLLGRELTSIPESIGDLINLIELNLCGNRLTKLPKSLGNLYNLQSLFLENNLFIELPEFVGNLHNLRELHLQNHNNNENENNLILLPKSICELKKLQLIDITGNCLTEIPDCIRKMPNLKIIGFRNQRRPSTPPKTKMKTYQQKILFGSPGTGKSYQIDKHIIPYELLIDVEKMPANVIKTVFHPEYTYGDFVGKLMPITVGNDVQYKFYEGHFLKALSQAYKNIIAAQENGSAVEKVALVIDEINRGNSAAIFGTIFQLLDREPDGWSSYEVSVNEIIFDRLFALCDLKGHAKVKEKIVTYMFGEEEISAITLQKKLNCHFENRTIKIPPNLSIIASMNTSDSSIYYMDSAFKRRWEWEFIDVDPEKNKPVEGVAFKTEDEWNAFVKKLNDFIKSNHKSIRGIEDKQIGQRFINFEIEGEISNSSIRNKLMFFLWDSVFNRDKKPLIDLLFKDEKHDESPLITFGDFAKQVDNFIDKINEH